MKRFGQISVLIILIQIILLAVFNVLLYRSINTESGLYKVECARVIRSLQQGEEVSADDYETILSIHEYDQNTVVNNDYKITFAGDKCYQIEYQVTKDYTPFIYLNTGFAITILMTVIVALYVGNKVLKPFERMSNVSVELAKGNLSAAVNEDKNKFFGRFVWGINMLRDNLQDNREKELSLQKEKKTLILSISHDIKTPLSSIKLYTKALQEGLYDTKEKQMEALEGISKNTVQIEKYVSEIVTASKEDFLNLEATVGEYYLADVITRVEMAYKEKLAVLHTEFSVDKYDNCLVSCDINRLIEAIENAIENAIKYGDGKFIRISFDEEEDCKLITVTNSGSTIKDAELPHLFESFYRGTNTEGIKGSGLGLYIAKTLMHLQGGEVYARNEDSDFAITFVVKLI